MTGISRTAITNLSRKTTSAMTGRTCKCNSNFAGYDCSKCEFGYYGSYCTQKKTLTRKNFLKLSDEEKDRYMRYINISKYFISDYVVTFTTYEEINETVMAARDPRALFYNVSNYDLFAWMHYYSARDTIYPHNITRADIDFAHDGQGFPTWHRLYMLAWERTLQEIGNDEDFALPYWDWTGNAERCDPAICSEELLGVTNQADGIVKGKYLDNWYVICTREQTNHLIEMCDPTNRKPGLERITNKEKEEKVKKRGFVMTFPTKKEVNFALRFATFDLPPYSKESSCNFKNILEGYASTKTGYRLPNVHNLHNQVHIAVGGDMGDVPSAANDPIFPLHHSFVDRIYENGFASSTKMLRFFPPSMRPLVTTNMTSLYQCFRCTLTNRCSKSLLSLVMTMKMWTRMVSMNFWLSFTFFLYIHSTLINCQSNFY